MPDSLNLKDGLMFPALSGGVMYTGKVGCGWCGEVLDGHLFFVHLCPELRSAQDVRQEQEKTGRFAAAQEAFLASR